MKKLISFALNDYPGSQNDLRGCVNDQLNVCANLQNDFGFHTLMFKNSQVTKKLFRDEVTKLVLDAKSGDIIVIHVSSHGTQLLDKSADEQDGYDEALYLYDGAFSDDEFMAILDDLEEGIFCVFIMDCCFSGTITREINKKARFKPLFSEVDALGLPVERKRRKLKEMGSENEMNHLIISGCSDRQTSADAYIGGSYNGALTYAAMKTLDPGITYKEWHKMILNWLSGKGYSQTPQLEGPDWMKNSSVFGSVKKKCWLLRLFSGETKQRPVEPPKPPKPPNP